MPTRKSTLSNPPEGEDATEASVTTPAQKSKDKDGLGVDDLTLPKSMIARLAKGVLPPNTQIQKDALLALHKSATVFVSYLASNSNDLAHMGGKKTISPQDVLSALKDAELESFLPRLELELKKYNEIQCDKRNSYRHRVKEEKAKPSGSENGATAEAAGVGAESAAIIEGDVSMNGAAQDHETGPPSKKLKGTDGEVVATPGEQVDDDEIDDAEPDGGEVEDVEDDVDETEDGEQNVEDEVEDELMVDVESEEDEGENAHGPDEALDDGDDSD